VVCVGMWWYGAMVYGAMVYGAMVYGAMVYGLCWSSGIVYGDMAWHGICSLVW